MGRSLGRPAGRPCCKGVHAWLALGVAGTPTFILVCLPFLWVTQHVPWLDEEGQAHEVGQREGEEQGDGEPLMPAQHSPVQHEALSQLQGQVREARF